MAYKSFIKGIGSTKSAGVGFLPVPQPASTTFGSAGDSGTSTIQLSGVGDPSLFNIGNLVNIRYSDDSPSVDTTIADITGDVITTTAPFEGIVLGGVLSQRFNPPKNA